MYVPPAPRHIVDEPVVVRRTTMPLLVHFKTRLERWRSVLQPPRWRGRRRVSRPTPPGCSSAGSRAPSSVSPADSPCRPSVPPTTSVTPLTRTNGWRCAPSRRANTPRARPREPAPPHRTPFPTPRSAPERPARPSSTRRAPAPPRGKPSRAYLISSHRDDDADADPPPLRGADLPIPPSRARSRLRRTCPLPWNSSRRSLPSPSTPTA